ncbi:MAG TPA: hypothetical protein PLS81_11120 [Deltaproteobacteria bacterium]|nr:hypothetical protein [Deltaproteobacteria bacterium]HPP79880.1 hypothetical protein [Deltaproteobacteria bacterium]
MDKVFFLGGLSGVLAGFVVIFYQALTFLQHNVWRPYTLMAALDAVAPSANAALSSSPGLRSAIEACPLSASLIVIGLVLLWVASRLRNRYA